MAIDKNGKKLPKGITQRADGLYMGRFEYHGEKFAVYDKSLKEVQKKLNDLRYEVEHGLYVKKQNLSLNAWFETWMLDYKKNTIKIGTYTIYENHNGISFDYVTCHCFRHTFTRCIENKMEPQVLKTILGHSSLSMTMDLYSHVLPNTKQEEMQKISNLF